MPYNCISNNSAGPQQFPPILAPPTTVTKISEFAPSPSPQSGLGGSTNPKSSVVPSTGSLPGFSPANGPASGLASGVSAASSSVNQLPTLTSALVLLSVNLLIFVAL